ncbi:MAG: hypothetical protein HWE23_16230 [Rhodobacteraceae bacterium]|nr:hypothetical protein [Paracoccaceae bacterium]
MLTNKFNSFRILLAALAAIALSACQGSPVPPEFMTTPNPELQKAASAQTTQGAKATFAFEPFTGIPGSKADELAGALGIQARQQGLTLVRRSGVPSTYRVKGFMSATGGGAGGTVFYVFDIVDSSGQRRKRISGVEQVGGTQSDPWSAVSDSTLKRIAYRSVIEIKAWLANQ